MTNSRLIRVELLPHAPQAVHHRLERLIVGDGHRLVLALHSALALHRLGSKALQDFNAHIPLDHLIFSQPSGRFNKFPQLIRYVFHNSGKRVNRGLLLFDARK